VKKPHAEAAFQPADELGNGRRRKSESGCSSGKALVLDYLYEGLHVPSGVHAYFLKFMNIIPLSNIIIFLRGNTIDVIPQRLESTMTGPLNVRRHLDGSIDVDFYRRRANRQRRLIRRLVLRRHVILISQAAATITSALTCNLGTKGRNKPSVVES